MKATDISIIPENTSHAKLSRNNPWDELYKFMNYQRKRDNFSVSEASKLDFEDTPVREGGEVE